MSTCSTNGSKNCQNIYLFIFFKDAFLGNSAGQGDTAKSGCCRRSTNRESVLSEMKLDKIARLSVAFAFKIKDMQSDPQWRKISNVRQPSRKPFENT